MVEVRFRYDGHTGPAVNAYDRVKDSEQTINKSNIVVNIAFM